LADDLVSALDIHETVAAPEVVQDIFHKSFPLFTPQAVLEHSRKLFSGTVLRALYITPVAGEADAAALRKALLEPVVPDTQVRADQTPLSFAQLPAIGPVGRVIETVQTGIDEIEQVNLANGVKVMLWPTSSDPGRVTVKLMFGAGYRAFSAQDMPYIGLGPVALVSAGQGTLGQDELDRITTGRKLGFDFRIDDGSFVFSADTRREDLADQLYLFAGKLATPRWDAPPILRAAAAARQQYASYAASPQGILERDLRYLQRGKDARFRNPSPDDLADVTSDGFRKVWAPILASGPIEVQIFGDFDRASAMTALLKTLGALPPRPQQVANVFPSRIAVPIPSLMPTTLTHRGDPSQAAAVVSWPTGGGTANLRESRQLVILSDIFSNRLLDALREKLGASYAPQVGSEWPLDLDNGGSLTAIAQLSPDIAAKFFAAADAIAADLAGNPPSADELARVIEPLRQQISRSATSTGFYMQQLEGATRDPARYKAISSIYADYTQTSPQAMQALAQKYLVKERAWRVAVVPEAKGKP
jgi:zinc protease